MVRERRRSNRLQPGVERCLKPKILEANMRNLAHLCIAQLWGKSNKQEKSKEEEPSRSVTLAFSEVSEILGDPKCNP